MRSCTFRCDCLSELCLLLTILCISTLFRAEVKVDQTLFFVLSLADSGCLLVYDRCCNLFNLVFARSQSSSTANEMSNDGLGFLIPKSLGMALGPDTTFVLNVQHRPLLHQWQMLLFKATASLVYHLSVSVRVTDRGGTCGFWLVTSKWFRGCEDGDIK